MDKFEGHYVKWREIRINKLKQILGVDWFKGKSVLELACGYGHIGQVLRFMGADVTQTEGRKEYADKAGAILLDQETQWNLDREFDLVIHWGVLYHLDNWKHDLWTTIAHGKIIALESEVVDSDDPNFKVKINEDPDDLWYDCAINKIGTRPSVAAIEKCITETGATFKRYDDKDLDIEPQFLFGRSNLKYIYSWKPGEFKNLWKTEVGYPAKTIITHLRRFWIIYKNEN